MEQYLRTVDRRLVRHMRAAVELVPHVEHLNDGVRGQVGTGGKRIRAALTVLSCELFCGDYMRALHYAAAIEHIQNFSLIHDDIADGDTERRSFPSMWKQHGVPHAINIGDAFVPLSSLAVLRSYYSDDMKLRLMETISIYSLEMVAGQSLDINLRTAPMPTIENYVECTKRKTGAFLAMAVVGGGIIGGAGETDLRNLSGYALHAGIAFQIKDDLIDIYGVKGRPTGSDILEGKITAPATYALSHAPVNSREKLRSILQKSRRSTTTDDVAWVINLYRETNALKYANGVIDTMLRQAYRHLIHLPNNPAKRRLIRLSRYLSRRLH
ncbi:MAG: polyprenyl synthetase family protein [Planctomycetota bacterium]|nr:polyprenyl synthetase family protein [Planctomycetota bacterium]